MKLLGGLDGLTGLDFGGGGGVVDLGGTRSTKLFELFALAAVRGDEFGLGATKLLIIQV